MSADLKDIFWLGSSKKDLTRMPQTVRRTFGHALHVAQMGFKHEQAKPMKGFGSAGVLEVVESGRGATYRAVYTVRIADAVYVLLCFQKKAKKGIGTPKADMDLIRERLREAEAHAKEGKGSGQDRKRLR